MEFSGLPFIFRFLPIFLPAYYFTPDKYKNAILILGSVAYYGAVSPPCAPILLVLVGLNLILARRVQQNDKICFGLGLILNVSALVFFRIGPITMPGISFLTFQMLAFQIDSYRGSIEGTDGFLTYALMFPKLLSGPIARYQDIRPELVGKKHIIKNRESGVELFVLGLGYKALLADRLGGLWNGIQAIGFESISVPLAWMGAVAFSLQIYFDFHGYTLMAVGLGRMLGFNLPDNFDSPYCSKSISEFYRRWHMTLGRWFKDYIYIPLGGNRRGTARTILNLFIVWLLTGLWHGIGYNYVLWGLFLFFFIALEKLFLSKYLKKSRVVSHLYVLFLIPVSWMFFAITKAQDIPVYMSRLFAPILGSTGINVYALDYLKYWRIYWPFITVGIIFALPWPERILRRSSGKLPTIIFMFVLFWLSVYIISINSNNPFMYFKF